MMPRTLTPPIALTVCLLCPLLGAAATSASAANRPRRAAETTPLTLPPAPVAAEPAIVLSTATVKLQTPSAGLLGHPLAFSGSTSDRRARRVLVQRYDPASGSWLSLAAARVRAHGAFSGRWRANLSGRVLIRTLVTAQGPARAAAAESSSPAEVTIYRPAIATYFGSGFYGKQTACGQNLTPFTLGVANRTLPCGTLVEVSYGGHRLTVPVIDRGPYANGASWDLTEATAQALQIAETVRLGALVVGRVANTPQLGLPAGLSEASLAATGGTAI